MYFYNKLVESMSLYTMSDWVLVCAIRMTVTMNMSLWLMVAVVLSGYACRLFCVTWSGKQCCFLDVCLWILCSSVLLFQLLVYNLSYLLTLLKPSVNCSRVGGVGIQWKQGRSVKWNTRTRGQREFWAYSVQNIGRTGPSPPDYQHKFSGNCPFLD